MLVNNQATEVEADQLEDISDEQWLYTFDYSATKGAIHALTYSLAQALDNRGVRVNCVVSGSVWTPLIRGHPRPGSRRRVRWQRPDGATGRPGRDRSVLCLLRLRPVVVLLLWRGARAGRRWRSSQADSRALAAPVRALTPWPLPSWFIRLPEDAALHVLEPPMFKRSTIATRRMWYPSRGTVEEDTNRTRSEEVAC